MRVRQLLLNTLLMLLLVGVTFCAFAQDIRPVEPEQMTQGEFVIRLVRGLGWDSGFTNSTDISLYIKRLKDKGIKLADGFKADKIITKDDRALLVSKALALEIRSGKLEEVNQRIRDRAVIIHLEGDVWVRCGDSPKWIPAKQGMRLSGKDYIRTGPNSQANLSVGISGRVRIKENTELFLKNLSTEVGDKSETVCLYLAMGEMTVDVKRLNEDSTFITETQTALIGVRGTIYNIRVAGHKAEIN